MAQGHVPPPARAMALYSFGGGFIGALLAIILAWLFTGGFCCDQRDRMAADKAAAIYAPAAPETVS